MMNDLNPDKKFFHDFVSQLSYWSTNGIPPKNCSPDVKYALALQAQRLRAHNVVAQHHYCKTSENDSTELSSSWSNKDFANQVAYRHFITVKDYYINGKRTFSVHEPEVLYSVITKLQNGHSDKTYCCPNCGAIDTVRTLLEKGCPNCKTRFIMSDFFPQVTTYFSVRDYSQQSKKADKYLSRFTLIGGAIGLFGSMLITLLVSPQTFFSIESLGIWASAAFSFAGLFCVSSAFIAIIHSLSTSFNTRPKVSLQHNAKYKLPKFMKQFDPGFTYEYFVGKAMAMTRIMVFSSDYRNLAVYAGPPIINTYRNIIDVQFNEVISVNSCTVKGAYCYLDLFVYTINTYCYGTQISKKNERFRIVLCKNIMNDTDYNFSLQKVQCNSCGGSFDATKMHKCPYCNSDYHSGEDDWVVLNFHKA